MSDTEQVRGGFASDPAAALAVTGTSGCCGSPAQTTPALPDPGGSGGTCCGTQAEAVAENSCCGSAAKADAVTSGQGCCG